MTLKRLIFLILVASLGFLPRAAWAESWERWEAYEADSDLVVSHLDWSVFLDTYVARDPETGVNLLDYAAVSPLDRARLKNYIDMLESLPIRRYNRNQQLAYWLNLYNALTVDLILDSYPVDSIRDIDISPGLFSDGPWGKKLAVVEGVELSLDDIEHRILRPIWRDPRIHYGVNCAAIGCPNLRAKAFTGRSVDAMLDAAARDYVNNPRGAQVTDEGRLVVSSLYDWYEEDFGGSERAVIEHLRRYAEPELAARLADIDSIADYRYDWALNAVPSERSRAGVVAPHMPWSMSTSKILKYLREQ